MASKPEIKTATPEIQDAINGSIIMRLGKLQEELKKNPKNPENQQIRGQIAELRRELNRTKQYSNITAETSKKLIESKNMDTISASALMKIDRGEWNRGEFLSKSFLYKRTTDAEWNISEEPTNGKDLKEWDMLFVDFGKNTSAESKIWAGDFLPMNIKVVKITDRNWGIRIWKRSIQWNKVGYYDENGYIPVYNGYIVEIPKSTETDNYLKSSNPSIIVSSDEETENKAKDTFIEIANKYEQFGEWFSPWNIIEKKEFQKKATDLAKNIESKYGIPWQVTYAQTTLETGYGRSAPNNNYFWIKWGKWSKLSTKEFINWKEVEINANFRWYNSMEESFEDYARLLTTNPIYQGAFQYKDNPELFLKNIIASGYATDPIYVEKAKKIWANYDKIKDFNIDTPEIVQRTTPDALINQAMNYLGTKYSWWGNSEYGIDCSHLISKSLIALWAAKNNFYRVAADLRNLTPNKPLEEIKRWDLIFWHGWEKWVSHVAIATGSPMNGAVNIIDASWNSGWAGKVSERNIPLTNKLSAGTPPFYS